MSHSKPPSEELQIIDEWADDPLLDTDEHGLLWLLCSGGAA